jgi:hypothetical protein
MYNFWVYKVLYTENDLILQYNLYRMSKHNSFCHIYKIKGIKQGLHGILTFLKQNFIFDFHKRYSFENYRLVCIIFLYTYSLKVITRFPKSMFYCTSHWHL